MRGTRLFYDRRVQRIAVQAAFVALLLAVGIYVYVRATRLELSFDFLGGPSGFALSNQFLTDYRPNADSHWDAYLVGVWNTLRIVSIGIVLATVLGVVGGVARLSSNWLVSRLATLYVEIVRNTPLLVQIIFWWGAVLLARLPKISEETNLFGVLWISNRALAVPSVEPRGTLDVNIEFAVFSFAVSVGLLVWLGVLAASAVGAWLLHRRLAMREALTGRRTYAGPLSALAFLVIAVVSFMGAGLPLGIDTPDLVTPGRGAPEYVGGMQITPEFAALMIALVVYTGAFITEIVRGSIQALPRGQSEAAMALGLNSYQRLTLVILPQALRTMIPALTNQYLNLSKNSSLAVVIGFSELFFVGTIVVNNAGHAVPMFLVIIGTYVAISLTISAAMNFLNSRVQLVGQ